jgi:hypothetical protein
MLPGRRLRARIATGIVAAVGCQAWPVAGTPGLISTFFDLASVGYLRQEFFLEGSATRFELAGTAGDDGFWTVRPAGRAPFTTRLVVYRPAGPDVFSGTVVVEWLNVSAGADIPADWLIAHRQIVRSGCAWAGVSAQRAGIEGGSIFGSAGVAPDDGSRALVLPALKASDPARYGGLSHPGDAFSFDIFSQAGQAVRAAGSGGVLGPLPAGHVLAVGHSQAAFYLVTYVNAIAPAADVYDGYLLHGRPCVAAPLQGWDGRKQAEGPACVRVRTDGRAPVMTVQTETDVAGEFAAVTSRQPDSGRFRLWEIAGAAHADTYTMSAAFTDSGELPPAELARLMAPTTEPAGIPCPAPVNSGPQHHYVVQAALAALDRWVRDGAAPPSARRLETDPGDPMRLVCDARGIARGGVRTGWTDVPAAVLSGLCPDVVTEPASMFGTTRVFDDARLASLYPGGSQDYLAAFRQATLRAVAEGFLLGEDAEEIVALAAAAYPGARPG